MAGIDTRLEQKFSAVPVHSPRSYERRGLDPRLGRKLLRTSSLTSEERQMLVKNIAQSRWSPRSRCVYGAVTDGFSTVPEIETVTGLTSSEVEAGIRELERKGMLRRATSG